MFNNKRKGSAYTWLVITVAMVMVGLIYVISSGPLVSILPVMKGPIEDAPDSDIKDNALEIFDVIENTSLMWPLLLLFGLVLWGIMSSFSRERHDYSY